MFIKFDIIIPAAGGLKCIGNVLFGFVLNDSCSISETSNAYKRFSAISWAWSKDTTNYKNILY